jgi:hypothetical protein
MDIKGTSPHGDFCKDHATHSGSDDAMAELPILIPQWFGGEGAHQWSAQGVIGGADL